MWLHFPPFTGKLDRLVVELLPQSTAKDPSQKDAALEKLLSQVNRNSHILGIVLGNKQANSSEMELSRSQTVKELWQICSLLSEFGTGRKISKKCKELINRGYKDLKPQKK